MPIFSPGSCLVPFLRLAGFLMIARLSDWFRPCQPFSAGRQSGRWVCWTSGNLWPHFFHLISERRPSMSLANRLQAVTQTHGSTLVQADRRSGIRLRACAVYVRRNGHRTSEREFTGWLRVRRWRAMSKTATRTGSRCWRGREPVASQPTGPRSISSLDNADKPGPERHFPETQQRDGKERLDQLPRQAF